VKEGSDEEDITLGLSRERLEALLWHPPRKITHRHLTSKLSAVDAYTAAEEMD
jgi:hypothetical protein